MGLSVLRMPTTFTRRPLSIFDFAKRALHSGKRPFQLKPTVLVEWVFSRPILERPTSWLRNGWKSSQKKPVENRDLWEALIAEVGRHQVTWHKVAGHSGDPLNDRADRLAVAAIDQLRART